MLPGTANLATYAIAGCYHLAKLMAWSQSNCPSVPKVSWRQQL